jgi:hypothetical protein
MRASDAPGEHEAPQRRYEGAGQAARALSARLFYRRAIAASVVSLALFAGCDGGDDGDIGATASPAAVESTAGATRAVLTATPGTTPASTLPPPISSGTTLSIDADPATPEIDARAASPAGAGFDVAVVLETSTEPAQGFQLDLAWDAGILEFVLFESASGGAFPACSRTITTPGSASAACLRTQDETAYTGPLARFRLRCLGAGETALRLRLPAPEVIGTKIESAPGRNIQHELTLRDATISCG